MASTSKPRPGYNGGALTTYEHELLLSTMAPDGVFGKPGDSPVVFADGTGGRAVKIRAGKRARLRGTLWDSGATDITLPELDANDSGQTRVDLVVVRLDRAGGHEAKEFVITGVPGANPVAPAPVVKYGEADVFDLPLAEVRVESGATAFAADKVKPINWWVGDDGQIRCTSSTRPPHEINRVIWEHDTGRQLLSDGAGWRVVYDDSGMLTMTPASGWGAAPINWIRRRSGLVVAALSIQRTGNTMGATGDVQVATIPAGLRPTNNIESPALVLHDYPTLCTARTDGRVTVRLAGGIKSGAFVILNLGPWFAA